jgi:RES domain-containing protein
MQVCRLVKARFSSAALFGSGAKAYGGRWNSKGIAMIYTSDCISLAALELLVHLHRAEVLNQYRLFTLQIPDDGVMSLDESALPEDWRRDPPPSTTVRIGDEWSESLQSIALAVPSAIVPQQRNILLNPTHGEFDSIVAGASNDPLDFDPRLA